MALDYLPSPGWAVIYGETPSATRWSELGDNDDALATGAGIDDLAILTRHLAAKAVTGAKVNATDLVKYFKDQQGQINYANAASFSTYYDMTGASYSITPTRNVMFIAMVEGRFGNGSGNRGMRITQNGTVVSPEISQNLNASGGTLVGFTFGTINSGVATTLKAQMASAVANDIIYSAQFSVLVLPID
jgi:hypothetical protein